MGGSLKTLKVNSPHSGMRGLWLEGSGGSRYSAHHPQSTVQQKLLAVQQGERAPGWNGTEHRGHRGISGSLDASGAMQWWGGRGLCST